jgi:hypothetical protein
MSSITGSVSTIGSNTNASDVEQGSVNISPEAIYLKYGLLRFDKDFIFQSLSHIFQNDTTNKIVGITNIELTSDLTGANEEISKELKMTNLSEVDISFDNLQNFIQNDNTQQ